MTKLLYCNINEVSDTNLKLLTESLPEFFKSEIKRYRNYIDVKSRVIGKLMLIHSLRETKSENLLDYWFRDKNNKPSIKSWFNFNISHSHDLVTFAYSDELIGIDIEKKVDFEYMHILPCLHNDEISFIKSGNSIDRFYEIWVKKEALLKADGVGITADLRNINVSLNFARFKDEMWYFHNVLDIPGYKFSLASKQQLCNISVRHFPIC
jgi:4'-phosphopantetheinyl transferase